MNSSVARHEERQQKLARQKARPVELPDAEVLAEMAAEVADRNFVERPGFRHASDLVSGQISDVRPRLAELEARWWQVRESEVFQTGKTQITLQIANAFGLSSVVGLVDQRGGQVDTLRNVRNGVYATEEERQRYAARGEYDTDSYHSNPNYIAKGREGKVQLQAGTLHDAFTGKKFKAADIHHQQNRPSVDHLLPAKWVHDDPARVLAEVDGVGLANMDTNLAYTAKTLNSAKGTRSPVEFGQYLQRKAEARRGEIAQLESSSTALSATEQNRLTKLKVQDAVDPKALEQRAQQAKDGYDATINEAYQPKLIRAAGQAALHEGAKVALRQLAGQVMKEFFEACYDEGMDLWRNGRQETSVWKEIKCRLKRIARRVIAKWKLYLGQCLDGGLAGALSSLLTTWINSFITTAKRAVRAIREGAVSLIQAIRSVWFRPDGMDKATAWHEASKILVGGLVITAGGALEEQVEKMFCALPLLSDIAAVAVPALTGAMTIMVTGLTIYGLDRLDYFGVNARAQQRSVSAMLEQDINVTATAIEQLLGEAEAGFVWRS